jgi:hypothetical protein
MREFYKARLSERNGYIDLVDHWLREVQQLLHTASLVLDHSIRGFTDKQLAIREAIELVKKKESSIRTKVRREIINDYQQPREEG